MSNAATATNKGVICKVVHTPRPAFPWYIEVMPPFSKDSNTCHHFATEEAALAVVRERSWRLYKRPPGQALTRFLLEFLLVTMLLLPVVYQLFSESTSFLGISMPALCINSYTTVITTIMVAAFVFPMIKVIILMVSTPKSDFVLDRFIFKVIAHFFVAWGFLVLFMGALSNAPTALETLEYIQTNRKELLAKAHHAPGMPPTPFAGMTLAEYYANGPVIHLNGRQDYHFHEQNPAWEDSQRAYKRLTIQAAKEARMPFEGVHIYKAVLNAANDLWLKHNIPQ